MLRGAMAGDELVIKMSQPAAIGTVRSPDQTAIPIDRTSPEANPQIRLVRTFRQMMTYNFDIAGLRYNL